MGNGVDPIDADDPAWEAALREGWQRLSVQFRPSDADALVDIIRTVWQFPHHGIMEDTPDARAAISALDQAYDRFAEAAEGLRALLRAHEHYFVLPALLAPRSLADCGRFEIEAQLKAVQIALEAFPPVPRLPCRPKNEEKFKPVQAPLTRVVVQAVAWYLVNVEHQAVRVSFAREGARHPTSRAANLAEATLISLGIPFTLSELRNHLLEVKKMNLGDLSMWDICKPL